MPYLTLVIPHVAAENKAGLLSAWPGLAAEMKSQAGVAGVSGGRIAVQNGKKLAEDDFAFMQTIAYANKDDWHLFKSSAWVTAERAKTQNTQPPVFATYELSALPSLSHTYTQFTLLLPKAGESIDIAAATAAWQAIMVATGKDAEGPMVGGVSVETENAEAGEELGGGLAEAGVVMGLMGWGAVDEGREVSEREEVKGAWKAFGALGREVRSVLIKLEVV